MKYELELSKLKVKRKRHGTRRPGRPARVVVSIDGDGKERFYGSLKAAAHTVAPYRGNPGTIINAMKDNHKAYGFRWRYAEEHEAGRAVLGHSCMIDASVAGEDVPDNEPAVFIRD